MYDESESEPLTQPDTENHTKFHGFDPAANYNGYDRLDGTESYEDYYTRLSLINTGIWTGTWADENQRARQEKLAIFDALAGQLDLTPFQKEQGRTAFDGLNLRELSSPGGIDTTLVAICVAAVVVRRDGRKYHPQANDESNDDLFTALLDDFGYDDSVIHSCLGKVRYRLEGRGGRGAAP